MMGKMLGTMVAGFLLLLSAVAPVCGAEEQVNESEAQQRLAYFELSRVRSLSSPGVSFRDYREAVGRARQYVGLLRGNAEGGQALRQAMASYQRALALWSLREESDAAVDSLRCDQPQGAALLRECPDIPRFHRKGRDQVYVLDGVACVWETAARQMERVPTSLR